MKRRFEGEVVMLTGAAGGFGRAAAQRFAAEGARLALCDADADGMAGLVADLAERTRVYAAPFDIGDEVGLAGFLAAAEAALGPVTCAVNNAGIGQTLSPLQETPAEEFDRVMAVNARRVFLCMKHQLARMIPAGRGVIVNVASAAGLVGAGQMAAYAASKHAVVGLTRSAADEAARSGVRVNALCPAFAPTPLYTGMAEGLARQQGETRTEADRRFTRRIPMRRVAAVAEVVEAMLWLADPANSYMTGQAVAVDGGLTAV